jgi:hypothetical protein
MGCYSYLFRVIFDYEVVNILDNDETKFHTVFSFAVVKWIEILLPFLFSVLRCAPAASYFRFAWLIS